MVRTGPYFTRPVGTADYQLNNAGFPDAKRGYFVGNKARTLNDVVKRQIERGKEHKLVTFTPGTTMNAGDAQVVNVMYGIAEGLQSDQRIGKDAHISYIDFTLQIAGTAAQTEPLQVLVALYWDDNQYAPTSNTWTPVVSSSIGTTLPFVGSVSSGQVTNLQISELKATKVKLMHFVIPPDGSNRPSRKINFRYNCKHRRYIWQAEATSYSARRNLYLCVIQDVSGSVLSTSPVGGVNCTYKVNFTE